MIKVIIMFKRRAGMTMDEFKAYRRDVHAPLLFAIPEAKYIRRFVASFPIAADGWPEPSHDAIIEAWFDTIETMNAMYFSANFTTQVDPDHENFIDLSTVQRMIAEETVVIG